MNQGLICERQNFKNFKSKHKNYLYDLGRTSLSKTQKLQIIKKKIRQYNCIMKYHSLSVFTLKYCITNKHF